MTLDVETRYRLLLDVSQQISRTIELQDTLDHLILAVRSAVACDAAGIFVLRASVPVVRDAGVNMIAGMATTGFDRSAGDDPMLRLGKGIIGHVIATGETVIAPDVQHDPRYVVGRRATRSEVAVPILSNQQVIGALNLESDRLDAFTAADCELLEFFAVAAALAIEKAMLHREMLEKHRQDQQLAIAQQVQASLLPSAAPAVPGFDLAGINLPTFEIGGDYFDFIPLSGGRLGLVVADVSGKGVAAALIMATFRAALRTGLQNGGDVSQLMSNVDRVLLESTDPSRFVTAVYGVLEPASGELTYINCGHNPPLRLSAMGECTQLRAGGPALGMIEGGRREPGMVRLAPGDTLVLYTDGVVEATASETEEFGVDRLAEVVGRGREAAARDVVHSVVEATQRYTGRRGFEDDFTLVVVRRNCQESGVAHKSETTV